MNQVESVPAEQLLDTAEINLGERFARVVNSAVADLEEFIPLMPEQLTHQCCQYLYMITAPQLNNAVQRLTNLLSVFEYTGEEARRRALVADNELRDEYYRTASWDIYQQSSARR